MATIDPRPSGKWRAQVRRQGFKPKSKSFTTKALAERWARELEANMDRGVEFDTSELKLKTVADLLDQFLRDEVPQRKGARWETVRIGFWKTNAEFVFSRLDKPQALVTAVREYVRKRTPEVTAATINRELNLLSGVFKTAIKKWGLPLQENPVHAIGRPAVRGRGPGKLWTEEDLEKIKAKAIASGYCVDGSRLKLTWDYVVPAVELSLATAMRIGEVCCIEAADVHLEEQFLLLDETKNGDWRKVPLSNRAVEILKPLVARARSAGAKDTRVVPMSSDTLGLRFRSLRNEAGLAGLRFHDTRHTAATTASKKLSNILELSAFTGHRSLQSLKRYYHADATDIAKKLG